MIEWRGNIDLQRAPDDDSDEWLLGAPFAAVAEGWAVHIAPGFVSDGASIPRIAWRLIGHPLSGDYIAAALIHDALYAAELWPRADCDSAFNALLQALGLPAWKRWMMYAAVRAGGWRGWNAHTPESIAAARRYCVATGGFPR